MKFLKDIGKLRKFTFKPVISVHTLDAAKLHKESTHRQAAVENPFLLYKHLERSGVCNLIAIECITDSPLIIIIVELEKYYGLNLDLALKLGLSRIYEI